MALSSILMCLTGILKMVCRFSKDGMQDEIILAAKLMIDEVYFFRKM